MLIIKVYGRKLVYTMWCHRNHMSHRPPAVVDCAKRYVLLMVHI